MNNPTTKPKVIVKKVKHVFNPEEVAGLNVDFGQSFDALQATTADAKSQAAVLKSKVAEAECRMTTLRATINAGFEMRDKRCIAVLLPKEGKKAFYLEPTADIMAEFPNEWWKRVEPVIIEPMTDDDYQQELIAAESKFEARDEIQLFSPVGDSSGVLVVGRLKSKWYGALRVNIPGKVTLEERLDAEQPAYKQRYDQIRRSVKRFRELLVENLGAEEAKGFDDAMDAVVQAHREREE